MGKQVLALFFAIVQRTDDELVSLNIFPSVRQSKLEIEN